MSVLMGISVGFGLLAITTWNLSLNFDCDKDFMGLAVLFGWLSVAAAVLI